MKNLFSYTIISCLFSITLAAQQNNSLRGKVFFLSSGKTPAVGVEISGEVKELGKANSTYSASDGSYHLIFTKAGTGHLVDLRVGDTDASGQALEVVNQEEIKIWRIPENPEEEFDIIVCRKGERDVVAQGYYKIIKSSADQELKKKKAEWAALLDQKGKDYEKIAELGDMITRLEKQADSIPLYKEAFRIASINKDNAGKRVLKYLDLLDKGRSIQEAREELSIKKAVNELEKGGSTFNAGIEELEIRASASKSIFDYKDAISCYDTIIYYSEEMKIDRLKMAGYYTEIAEIFLDDGNYLTALNYLQKVIAIQKEILEPKHPDLAASYNNIGTTYEALGHYKKALEYHQKSIDIMEEVIDPKHPDLAITYDNIALTYQALNLYNEALEYDEKAIAIQEEILDPKHPDLATSYNNIALIYYGLGQYKIALKYHKKSLKIRKEILDSIHPDLGNSYNNLGATYQDLGQYEKALEYYQKSVDIKEEVLGLKHPDLATAYNNISAIYFEIGQYATALKYQQKAIDIREEILPQKHPDLARSYANIGPIHEVLGEYDKAIECQKKAISIIEEVLGPKNINLAKAYNNIAQTYYALKQYEKAMNYHQKSLKIREEALGSKHPDLTISYNNIALTYQSLGQYKEALKYQQKAIAIQEDILSPEHPDLGVSYLNIATTHVAIKDFQKAIAFQKKCLTIFKEALPKDHPYQKKALNRMGGIYYDSKNYPQAITTYQKAVKGFPEIKTQYFYNNIGLAYAKNSQFKEAYTAFTKYEKLFSNQGRTYRNWAMYYALQNEKEKALSNLQKAIGLGYKDVKWFKTDDSMDSLRNEKVFIELLEKLEKEK